MSTFCFFGERQCMAYFHAGSVSATWANIGTKSVVVEIQALGLNI